MAYRLGIDVGGTFTDAILLNEETGEFRIGKVPSTLKDPSTGFIEATNEILKAAEVGAGEVAYIVHGTTVATNAIIEGTVARTGFITTEGYRDMLEIARQIRPSLYDLQFQKPKPLVPRHLCFGVTERLDAKGQVLTPFDEEKAQRVVARLKDEKVEAIAVCLLHAYRNPDHERRLGVIVSEFFPEAVLSLSSDVAPEFREYYRASTTVINASIGPVVGRYLERIQDRLLNEGFNAELLLMQSGGGVFTFSEAIRKPVFMVESGPAAGVISATHLGDILGHRDIISFDMGGTTAKTGLIQDGSPTVTKEYEVGSEARAGLGSQRGGGYPIRTPVIDLVEIGAGGGSIAWVDEGGILRVGPQSAGADPGPVCYGQGGLKPTITDANVVLGRIQPDLFLGGRMKLNRDAARQAIEQQCAKPLGMDVVEAAYGIVEIANAAMVNALRLVSVQKGYDPREFVLVAFGGAGPLHANRLAVETEMPTLIVPVSPGTFSALGLLVTDLKHDFSTTWIQRLDQLDVTGLEVAYSELENHGRMALEREEGVTQDCEFVRQLDLRFVGQSHELAVTAPSRQLTPVDVQELRTRFLMEHDRAYGFSAPDEPVELVNLRLTAIGKISKPKSKKLQKIRDNVENARRTSRSVYFVETNGYTDCPVYDRYQLAAEQVISGPAIVAELDSTTVIHPGYDARVDHLLNLVITASLG